MASCTKITGCPPSASRQLDNLRPFSAVERLYVPPAGRRSSIPKVAQFQTPCEFVARWYGGASLHRAAVATPARHLRSLTCMAAADAGTPGPPATSKAVDAEVFQEGEDGDPAMQARMKEASVTPPLPLSTYHRIEMENCDFLIGRGAPGTRQLDLRTVFVFHHNNGKFSIAGGDPTQLPATPQVYQEILWAARSTDMSPISERGPDAPYFDVREDVSSVYLVRVASEEPYQLDLDDVVKLDGGAFTVTKVGAPGGEDGRVEGRMLRIMGKDQLAVEEIEGMPTANDLVAGVEMKEEEKRLEAFRDSFRAPSSYVDPNAEPPEEDWSLIPPPPPEGPPPRPPPKPFGPEDRKKLESILSKTGQ